jgi:hypothetical protein
MIIRRPPKESEGDSRDPPCLHGGKGLPERVCSEVDEEEEDDSGGQQGSAVFTRWEGAPPRIRS